LPDLSGIGNIQDAPAAYGAVVVHLRRDRYRQQHRAYFDNEASAAFQEPRPSLPPGDRAFLSGQ
jgi:hypothetical protein